MMYDLIAGFPTQLADALALGRSIPPISPRAPIHNVVISGLGGSGIGANIAESICLDELCVPVGISKTYTIPAYVGEHTLFIACSFSGGTEETLAALALAMQRNAQIFCITTGGKLLEIAHAHQLPYVQMPNKAPCPRAFLGYSLTQLLYTLRAYGLIGDFIEHGIEEAIALLTSQDHDIRGLAQGIADKYVGKQIILYADTRTAATAVRAQQQINENAKQLCHVNVFPEMNHNELVGWGLSREVYHHISVTLLKTDYDHPRSTKRMEICTPLFAAKAAEVMELRPQGTSFIAQQLYLIYLYDWVSYYLAERNGVDAFEINAINHLKSELAKFQ